MGLARLDNVDAMSFDESVLPKIFFDYEKPNEDQIGIKIINAEGETIRYSGVSKSWLEPNYIAYLLGVYSSNEVEKYRLIRQEIFFLIYRLISSCLENIKFMALVSSFQPKNVFLKDLNL